MVVPFVALKLVYVMLVKFAFVAKRFVAVAFWVTSAVPVAFRKARFVEEANVANEFVVVALVPEIFAKFAVPVKVGEIEKTAFPVPVSSVRSARSSAEVSIDDEETFSVRSLKLLAERTRV